jgi:hypothetical protein
MTRKPRHPRPAAPVEGPPNIEPTPLDHPVFAQPQPTNDPVKFQVKHPSDGPAYKRIDELNREHKLAPTPFPAPRDLPEPRLTLATILGDSEASVQRRIESAGKLVFHSAGDTGSTRGPETQNRVADKMVNDFTDDATDQPSFFFHLGDVVYSFGEAAYYYDQFYEPYRDYPAPVVAIAGNHDGMVAPGVATPTLAAFLANFCADKIEVTPEAGGLSRTAQIQPGVFFTFEAPYLRILALYSNTLEDPGYISNAEIGDSQIKYLQAALARVKSEKYEGALIIAHHHPAYTAGSKHGWSEQMLAEIDKECKAAGVWPHAVLSAHAHNYQRFTRHRGDTQIPYFICGNGGHGLTKLRKKGESGAFRTPMALDTASSADPVMLENYDDTDYGYLRIVVDSSELRIEYHPASDDNDAKTPDDIVIVNLAARTASNSSARPAARHKH